MARSAPAAAALAPRLSAYDAMCLAVARLPAAPGYSLPRPALARPASAPACGPAGFYRLEVKTGRRWHCEASGVCRLDLARWARVGFPGRPFRIVVAD